ncbi:hypothetical protein Pmani_013619 [Petrolisthes manimaculis]|uniref:Uncharacterized protein n=1 Tax=Petrolisthes manimaculis TaxID=1843537 RepID=A0AAE1PW21_9EUCA|nr:hypothetical protein Pmani_013619 [Petrolisthes manimaculis]
MWRSKKRVKRDVEKGKPYEASERSRKSRERIGMEKGGGKTVVEEEKGGGKTVVEEEKDEERVGKGGRTREVVAKEEKNEEERDRRGREERGRH